MCKSYTYLDELEKRHSTILLEYTVSFVFLRLAVSPCHRVASFPSWVQKSFGRVFLFPRTRRRKYLEAALRQLAMFFV